MQVAVIGTPLDAKLAGARLPHEVAKGIATLQLGCAAPAVLHAAPALLGISPEQRPVVVSGLAVVGHAGNVNTGLRSISSATQVAYACPHHESQDDQKNREAANSYANLLHVPAGGDDHLLQLITPAPLTYITVHAHRLECTIPMANVRPVHGHHATFLAAERPRHQFCLSRRGDTLQRRLWRVAWQHLPSVSGVPAMNRVEQTQALLPLREALAPSGRATET
mmetsp:Transcript_28610/g.91197  ORF Transcript_28610/g.91197 Transcript_28610/m.91197 type:complete len:223 (+) Transcript_28610:432-1100(+)